MAERRLHGCHILIVEDEYLLADELRVELEDVAATVIGPAGALDAALALIRSTARIDGAVLDLNLGGDMAYPAADFLVERGVPFMFTSGYDGSAIPDRFAGIVRYEKPIDIRLMTAAIERLIHG